MSGRSASRRARLLAGSAAAAAAARRASDGPEARASQQPVAAAAAGHGPVGDRHVADLGGETAPARQEAPVGHDPAADAGAHRDVDDVGEAAAGAEAPLGERGDVGVVLQPDLEAQPRRQEVAQRHVAPAGQGRRVVHDAGGRVQRTGRADAETGDRDVGPGRPHPPDEGRDLADDGRRASAARVASSACARTAPSAATIAARSAVPPRSTPIAAAATRRPP